MENIKKMPKDLADRIARSEIKNNEEYEKAVQVFLLGDRVVYHTDFGLGAIKGKTGTVTTCRTGNGKLVVTLDGETGDNTYQLSEEYIEHIKN